MAGPLTLALERIAHLHAPVAGRCPLCSTSVPCLTLQAAVEVLELEQAELDEEEPTLGCEGGVSMFDSSPFVHLRLGRRLVGQVPPADARQIAHDLLATADSAEADAVALLALREVGLPDEVIAGYVARCRELRVTAPWVDVERLGCQQCGHSPALHPIVGSGAAEARLCSSCPCTGYVFPGSR